MWNIHHKSTHATCDLEEDSRETTSCVKEVNLSDLVHIGGQINYWRSRVGVMMRY